MSKQPGGAAAPSIPMLDIEVDRSADIPIGVQLAWALRSRIESGQLQAGQRLPGLRDVARSSGVNVNTVRAVYQRLEHEGLLDSQQGSGTFVASSPPRRAGAASIAADAAREAHATGVDPREVAAALYVTPARGDAEDEQAARRRALREQIAALERTMGELEAKHPSLAPPAEPVRTDGPTLLDADALERVRTGLLRRLSTMQASIDALGDDTEDGERGHAAESAGQARAGAVEKSPGRPATATKKPARGRPSASPAPAGA